MLVCLSFNLGYILKGQHPGDSVGGVWYVGQPVRWENSVYTSRLCCHREF